MNNRISRKGRRNNKNGRTSRKGRGKEKSKTKGQSKLEVKTLNSLIHQLKTPTKEEIRLAKKAAKAVATATKKKAVVMNTLCNSFQDMNKFARINDSKMNNLCNFFSVAKPARKSRRAKKQRKRVHTQKKRSCHKL